VAKSAQRAKNVTLANIQKFSIIMFKKIITSKIVYYLSLLLIISPLIGGLMALDTWENNKQNWITIIQIIIFSLPLFLGMKDLRSEMNVLKNQILEKFNRK
jgi:hypothetical protein